VHEDVVVYGRELRDVGRGIEEDVGPGPAAAGERRELEGSARCQQDRGLAGVPCDAAGERVRRERRSSAQHGNPAVGAAHGQAVGAREPLGENPREVAIDLRMGLSDPCEVGLTENADVEVVERAHGGRGRLPGEQ